MSLVVSVILLILIWFSFKFYFYLKNLYEKLSCFVRPPGSILLGHASDFNSTTKIIPALKKYEDEYGGLLRLDVGFCFPFILASDLKFLEYLLSSPKIIEKSEDYEFLHNWLGTGLLTSSASKWHQTRKMLTPAFHFQILDQFVDVFHEPTSILVEKFNKVIGKSFNVYPYVSAYTLDVICETSMGIKVNAQITENSDYVNSVKELARISAQRGFEPLKQIQCFYMLSKDYWKERRALKIVHNFTTKVITNRKRELLIKSDENVRKAEVDDTSMKGNKKRLAFLDLMLEAKIDGRPMSNEELQEEVNTFMFAGHDTTATAITFALYCLSNNPEIQEKVFEELQTVFEDDLHKRLNIKNIGELKYLEMVIKESLRLYPPVAMFARRVLQDEQFYGGTIPPGVPIVAWVYGVHRNPEIYPDPEKFDPERFTSENQSKRSPYSYIPFSAGPRNCIGQRFAMLEMKYFLANLIRNYKIHPVLEHKIVLSFETVVKSKNGIFIKLEHRL